MRDEGLLDQVRHLLLVVRGFEDAATGRWSRHLIDALFTDPELPIILDDLRRVCPYCGLLCAEVERAGQLSCNCSRCRTRFNLNSASIHPGVLIQTGGASHGHLAQLLREVDGRSHGWSWFR